MSRRNFLSTGAFALTGTLLARCSFVNRETPPEPHPPVAELEKLIAQGIGPLRHTWTTVRGLKIHALISTDPQSITSQPVVLVHGSGLSGRYMIPTAQQLTSDYRVYVPDLPGFGDSAKPEEVLDVPELADWLASWLAAVGLDGAALLGNSFGCQVIADLAARYPGRIAAAILQGPTTPPEERSWFWQFIRWRQNQRYNPRSLGSVTNEDYKKCGVRRMYGSFNSQLTDRIEDKGPAHRIPRIGRSRCPRSDSQSALVRANRPPLPARKASADSRCRAHSLLHGSCPVSGRDPFVLKRAQTQTASTSHGLVPVDSANTNS